MCHLSSIADSVIIVLVAIEAVRSAVVMLALPSRGREETFLAFSATTYTWWVMRVVNASHITLYLPTPTWYARLVDPLVLRCRLWLLLLSRRRAAGSIGAFGIQWILRCCGCHRRRARRLEGRCPSLSHGLGCKRLVAEVCECDKDQSGTISREQSWFGAIARPFCQLGRNCVDVEIRPADDAQIGSSYRAAQPRL